MRMAILTLLCFLLTANALECHYTCQTCDASTYTACSSCPDSKPFTFRTASQPTAQGVCGQLVTNNVNGVGIILIILAIATGSIVFNEQAIYLILFLQSLALVYLAEVYWLPVLDYFLSGLTYLMLITKASYNYKQTATSNSYPDICRGRIFFRQFELKDNFNIIGVIDLVLIVLIVAITLFKYCRKKCTKERAQFLPDWLLDKLVLIFSTAFLFLIQESVTSIFFSLKYGSASGPAIALTVMYFIALILFTLNHIFYPLPYFRSKIVQINVILGKLLVPAFLIASPKSHFLVLLFLIITWVIDLIFANTNRRTKARNRLLVYKLTNLGSLVVLTLYFMLEFLANKESISKGLGVLCTVVIIVCLHFLAVELVLEVKTTVCDKQLQTTSNVVSKKPQSRQNEELTLENIKIEEPQDPQPNNFNFNFQAAPLRVQTKISVPYTCQVQETEQNHVHRNNQEGTNSLNIITAGIPHQEVQMEAIEIKQRSHSDLQKLGPKDSQRQAANSCLQSEIVFEQKKCSNQIEQEPPGRQEEDDRQMTESKVPLRNEARRKNKRSKRKIEQNL